MNKGKSIIVLTLLILVLIAVVPAVLATEDCDAPNATACSVGSQFSVQQQTTSAIHSMNNTICILYFYSDTCSHCLKLKPFLKDIQEKYGDKIKIHKYEVGSHPENQATYFKFCQTIGYSGGSIPLLAIGNNYYIGDVEIKDNLDSDIQTMLDAKDYGCPFGGTFCSANANVTGSEMLLPSYIERALKISPMIVAIMLGLVDGINPCAFAVLLFIMIFLQQISSDKKRIVKVTSTYISAVLLINIILGIIYYYFTIQIGYPGIVRVIAGVLAVGAGLINIKDFFYYGKGLSLQIPKKSKRVIEMLVKRANVPAAFVLGALVSILEAGCSIPIYLTVIEILKSKTAGLGMVIPYLILYNIMFVLPLVVIAMLIYWGKKASHFENWRKDKRRYMKLAMGLVLVVLGIILILGFL